MYARFAYLHLPFTSHFPWRNTYLLLLLFFLFLLLLLPVLLFLLLLSFIFCFIFFPLSIVTFTYVYITRSFLDVLFAYLLTLWRYIVIYLKCLLLLFQPFFMYQLRTYFLSSFFYSMFNIIYITYIFWSFIDLIFNLYISLMNNWSIHLHYHPYSIHLSLFFNSFFFQEWSAGGLRFPTFSLNDLESANHFIARPF